MTCEALASNSSPVELLTVFVEVGFAVELVAVVGTLEDLEDPAAAGVPVVLRGAGVDALSVNIGRLTFLKGIAAQSI